MNSQLRTVIGFVFSAKLYVAFAAALCFSIVTPASAQTTCHIEEVEDIDYCNDHMSAGDIIMFDRMIICNTSLDGAEACTLFVTQDYVEVTASDPSYGITSTDCRDYQYEAIRAYNVYSVNIHGFTLNDVGPACDPPTPPQWPADTIGINNSSYVGVYDMTLDYSTRVGVVATLSDHVDVFGNTITRAGTYGVAFAGSPYGVVTDSLINSNHIDGSCDAAILAKGEDISINYNTITNNHRSRCVGNLGGGQLAIEDGDGYEILYNDIFNTYSCYDEEPMLCEAVDGGIELNPDVKTVYVEYNDVYDMSAFGIKWDYDDNDPDLRDGYLVYILYNNISQTELNDNYHDYDYEDESLLICAWNSGYTSGHLRLTIDQTCH